MRVYVVTNFIKQQNHYTLVATHQDHFVSQAATARWSWLHNTPTLANNNKVRLKYNKTHATVSSGCPDNCFCGG